MANREPTAAAAPHLRWRRWTAIVLAVLAAATALLYWSAGFFDTNAVRVYRADGPSRHMAVVYFSGDMGLHWGMGPYIVDALTEAGIPVYAVGMPALFGKRRSRADVDALVADSVREAMRRTGATRVILSGQSFGADIARVGIAHLPADLRPHVAALVLVVPSASAYFRADPLNLAYLGTPDVESIEARALHWLPITCISGATESDSLCPTMLGANVRRIALPGGHYLRMDHDLLVRTLFTALAPVLGAQTAPHRS